MTIPHPPVTPAQKKRLRITRDGILFVVGILGIVYETLVAGGDRPTLLVVFAGMCGLPVFLRTDEKAKDKIEAEAPPPAPTLAPPAVPAPVGES